MAPSEVSHGTMGPVEWLRYNDNPRVMNTDTRKTRGFIENFQQYFKKFIKVPYCLWYPKPCHSVETSTLQDPSSLSTPCNHLL